MINIQQRSYQDTLAACNESADLVACSPPYADARTYGANVVWTDTDYANLGDAIFSALRPGGHALVNVDAPVRKWRPGHRSERGLHPWRMMLDWADRIGFDVPDRLAYVRRGNPGEYKNRFRNDFEFLLWFSKPGGEPFFDKHSIAKSTKSYAGITGGNRKADGSKYRRTVSGWAVENAMSHRGTVWDYKFTGNGHTGDTGLESENHPARWPYNLASDLVLCFCPPGGLVCDPFVGAGTTGVAAIRNGRRFVGGDLYSRSEDGVPWAEIAYSQVMRARQQLQTFATATPATTP